MENFVVVDGNEYIDVGRDKCATDDLVSTVTFNLQKLAGVAIWFVSTKGGSPPGASVSEVPKRPFPCRFGVPKRFFATDDAQ